MKDPLRIAVLEAGYPAERAASKYGTYGGLFNSFLEASAAKLANPEFPRLQVTKWDVQKLEQYPSLDDIDSILITGSPANAFDDTPWVIKLVEFTRMILAEQTRVRVIGICFGHQIVARALGAKVDRNDKGWEASVVPMQLSPHGKRLFGGKDTLNLQQMHKDIVTELPAGLQLIGSSSACEIQGMFAPRRLITVQGHPEFTSEIVSELLVLRKTLGIFPKDTFEDMMRRVNYPHDGLEVGATILTFLNE